MILNAHRRSMPLLLVLHNTLLGGIPTLRSTLSNSIPTTLLPAGWLIFSSSFHLELINRDRHQGFLCTDCPKLFPRVTAPPPRPSPRAEARRSVLPWTRERILKERKEAFKKTRELAKKSGQSGDGIRIRGRWVSTREFPFCQIMVIFNGQIATRRQDSGLGSAFDGSHGVDSEDIFNIPEIGLGSFMVFPDQVKYGPDDPNLPPFNNTVKQGQDWIRSNVDMARL